MLREKPCKKSGRKGHFKFKIVFNSQNVYENSNMTMDSSLTNVKDIGMNNKVDDEVKPSKKIDMVSDKRNISYIRFDL